jgi:iron uptake system component EfeO
MFFGWRRSPHPAIAAALLLCAAALVASGCGSSGNSSTDGPKLYFELTGQGCNPRDAAAPAGPVVLEVENAGDSGGGELTVLDDEDTVGTVGDIARGGSGQLSVSLEKGSYELRCSGSADDGSLAVTAAATPTSREGAAAVARYRRRLERSADELIASAKPFTAVVVADKVKKSKALYPEAHAGYERLQPVAESFVHLAPRINALEGEVPEDAFGGFHLIEKTLWYEGTAATMAPVAKRLLGDLLALRRAVVSADLRPAQIATGAWSLMHALGNSKLTGKDPYSHTDLADFEADVEAAEAAFKAVEPLFSKRNPALAKEVEADFEKAYASLARYVPTGPYKHGDRLVPSTKLSEAEVQRLSESIDALAGDLAQVPAQVAG